MDWWEVVTVVTAVVTVVVPVGTAGSGRPHRRRWRLELAVAR
ncbi:hypothetical protein [Actinacidiphila rubida]|nr:hypothetical protein [Actinacidiphila rubida]